MIQIKKTILTLVALLAVTTGAWADGVLNIVVDGTSATIKYDGNANNNPYFGGDEWKQSEFPWDNEYTTRPTITTVTIDGSCKNFSGTSLRSLFIGFSGLTTINGLGNLNTANVQDMEYMFADCSSLTSLDLSSFNTASLTTMSYMFAYCSKLTTVDLSSWNTENVEMTSNLFFNCSELTTVDLSSWNTSKVWNTGYMFFNCSKLENIYVGEGWSTAKVDQSDDMFTGCTKLLSMNTANPATNKTNAHTGDGGYLKVKPASSGPKVDWNKDKKTGTFTMPGGNVTLEPEYYPQAALTAAPTAINDVPATTDGVIVSAGTVANIGTSEVKQGTLMYFVSQSTGNTAPTAPTYDTEGWSEDVPTANGLAQGKAYVWYYIKGAEPAQVTDRTDDNTRSDSDIMPLGTDGFVTIAAEPTYDINFKAANANTIEAGKATVTVGGTAATVTEGKLEGVKMGSKVKIKANTGYKFRKVEVKKKAAAKPLANATTEDLGKVVGADGNIYANKAEAEAANTTAVAMICYVNEGHGLALALSDISSHYHSWDNSGSYNEGKTAAELCSAWNTSKAVTGATWKLASLSEMNLMINAAGNYAALRDGFSAVGGTNMIDEYYWLSDESSAVYAKNYNFGDGFNSQEFKTDNQKVRACLEW